MQWMLRALIMILLLGGAAHVVAQDSGISKKEQEKIQARKEKEQAKGAKQAEKELRKRHLAIQGKGTRKRIKRNERRSDRTGPRGHREPFYKRWFRKKR